MCRTSVTLGVRYPDLKPRPQTADLGRERLSRRRPRTAVYLSGLPGPAIPPSARTDSFVSRSECRLREESAHSLALLPYQIST